MYVNDKPFNYLPITDGNPSPVPQANAIQTNGYSHMDITKIGDYLYAVMGKSNKGLSKGWTTMTGQWNVVCDTAIRRTEEYEM